MSAVQVPGKPIGPLPLKDLVTSANNVFYIVGEKSLYYVAGYNSFGWVHIAICDEQEKKIFEKDYFTGTFGYNMASFEVMEESLKAIARFYKLEQCYRYCEADRSDAMEFIRRTKIYFKETKIAEELKAKQEAQNEEIRREKEERRRQREEARREEYKRQREYAENERAYQKFKYRYEKEHSFTPIVKSKCVFFRGCNNKESIIRRYKELCKIYHPDSGNGDIETFREIADEYENILKNSNIS